jgi:hypothetical protein
LLIVAILSFNTCVILSGNQDENSFRLRSEREFLEKINPVSLLRENKKVAG